ncbi:MAG TPA: hypothetical protein VF114_07000 [Candidatus Limnocylindria bacterium]
MRAATTASTLVLVLMVGLAACGPASNATGCEVPSNVPIDGALLWLKADCGVQAAADGKVTDWASIVGALHALPAGPVFEPILEPDGLAGQPAIQFDGVFNRLDVDLRIDPSAHPDLTVVTVFASDVEDDVTLRKLYGADDGGYDRTVGIDPRATMNYTIFGGTSGVLDYFALSRETPYLTVDSFSSGAFDGWVNGAQALTGAPVAHGGGLPKFYLGGTGTVFLEPWSGPIAEMLVYGRTLTSDERVKVEDYFADKYELRLDR